MVWFDLRSLSLGLLSCGLLGAQSPQEKPAEASLMTVPICINLDPVFQTVERSAPRVPPGVETWMPLPEGKGATAYRFNLYREPLVIRLNGNHLLVRTTAQYWIEIGVKMGDWVKGVASCGLGQEGFRKAVLGVKADLSLTPKWGLDLKAFPQEPIPMTSCQITMLGYDITDKVVAGMKDSITKATQSMEQMVRDNAMLRQKAEAIWLQAQQPVEVTPGVFLLLHPERIRLGPWTSQGKILTITPQIQARPSLSLGIRPEVVPSPLPDLETSPSPVPPGFHMRVAADLSFEHATTQLRHQLAGKTLETEKGNLKVIDVCVRGAEGKAILEVQLEGKVNGRLTLSGHPIYNEQTGTLQLQGLDYTLESRGWITRFGEWLFRSSLRKTLAEKANWFMDRSLKDLKGQIQQGLNRSLADGLTMRGTLNDFKLSQPEVLSDRFRVDAMLEGQLQMDFSANPAAF